MNNITFSNIYNENEIDELLKYESKVKSFS